jgi:hypothetical protein
MKMNNALFNECKAKIRSHDCIRIFLTFLMLCAVSLLNSNAYGINASNIDTVDLSDKPIISIDKQISEPNLVILSSDGASLRMHERSARQARMRGMAPASKANNALDMDAVNLPDNQTATENDAQTDVINASDINNAVNLPDNPTAMENNTQTIEAKNPISLLEGSASIQNNAPVGNVVNVSDSRILSAYGASPGSQLHFRNKKATPAEREAAAERFKAIYKPTQARAAAPGLVPSAPTPSGIPHYFGPDANWA